VKNRVELETFSILFHFKLHALLYQT